MMVKTLTTIYIILSSLSTLDAFQTPQIVSVRSFTGICNAYIPDGFTKESYKKFKDKEKNKNKGKNLGKVGPKGFQSRSFQSFQEALERGDAKHLMPIENAKERIRKGELKEKDIPYMQRGGAWDNNDVKGAKKVKWLNSDKDYADGGYKKQQSASIFGGKNLDWTGQRERTGPQGRNEEEPPKKKFLGIF
mmetsp:Transcript_5498/g.6420  ORF Transcript_5498/g.6420 Transcript_5498/m.6420 type:complete len:191 (-) Transcript_5498:232-804(-)